MKNKRVYFYTLYKKEDNDLRLIAQFDTLEEMQDYIGTHYKRPKHVLDKLKQNLIIKKDYLFTNELEV